MHELALCEGVLRIIEEEAVKRQFRRVESILLEIGRLSHVDPQAMEFCFEAASKGTLAEGARLEIKRPRGEARCMECDRTVAIESRADPCPGCGGFRLRVTAGEDMRVKELEVA